MDKGSGCNFIDIVSAGQILAISTESNGMQRRAQSRPYFVRDRNHSVPGGDVPDSYFPTTGSRRVFSIGAENKRAHRRARERRVGYSIAHAEDLLPSRVDFPHVNTAVSHRSEIAPVAAERHSLHSALLRFYRFSNESAVIGIPDLGNAKIACRR